MKIVTDPSGRLVCLCSFLERHIPKGAGFRWDPASKVWWTDDPAKAARIAPATTQQATRPQPSGANGNGATLAGNAPLVPAPSAATPSAPQRGFASWRELPRRPACPYPLPPGAVEAWEAKERLIVTTAAGQQEIRAGDWVGSLTTGDLFVVYRKDQHGNP